MIVVKIKRQNIGLSTIDKDMPKDEKQLVLELLTIDSVEYDSLGIIVLHKGKESWSSFDFISADRAESIIDKGKAANFIDFVSEGIDFRYYYRDKEDLF